jgi:hypothetical protein
MARSSAALIIFFAGLIQADDGGSETREGTLLIAFVGLYVTPFSVRFRRAARRPIELPKRKENARIART